MGEKISISVGDDVFRYDDGRWLDHEGEPVDSIPHKYMEHGRMRTFYFHTDRHIWTDGNNMGLPNDKNIALTEDFKRTHGLNGEVELLIL